MKNLNILIFKNQNKQKETHPDYIAKIKLGNDFMDIGGGWTKKSAKGTSFLSLSLQVEPIKRSISSLSEEDVKTIQMMRETEEAHRKEMENITEKDFSEF